MGYNYLKKIYLNYICGKHSGIPTCCIIYFLIRTVIIDVVHNEKIENFIYSKTIGKSDFNYIPCPICSAYKKPKKIRNCYSPKNNTTICKIFSDEYRLRIMCDKKQYKKLAEKYINNEIKLDEDGIKILNLLNLI